MKKFTDLDAKSQWGLIGGIFAISLSAVFAAAWSAVSRLPTSSQQPRATATAPAQQQVEDAAPVVKLHPERSKPTATEPAPAESAPKSVVQAPMAEPAVVFTAQKKSDLSGIVSYKLTGPEKVVSAFDTVITAIDGGYKFEAAGADGERVYTRASATQALSGMVAATNGVSVTLKVAPSNESLDRLTKPMQELAAALGLPTEGVWTGNGPTRTFVLNVKSPVEIPPGKMK